MSRRTRMAIAVAIGLTCGACSATSDEAAPQSTRSSELARSAGTTSVEPYEFAYGASDGHIWVIDATTGARTQITHGSGGVDFDPHWSPDGRQLVFRTTRYEPPDPTSTGYNVIDVDGNGEHAVNPPGGGLFPAWSPDGTTIMFSSPRPDGTEGLFTVRPDGGELRDLSTYGEHVGWSPDGHELLIDRNVGPRQNWEIWRAGADLSNLTQLTHAPGDDHFGGWSPDGTEIVFSTDRTGNGDVWVMDRDGGDQHPLVDGDGDQAAEAWLPDGRIVVTDYRGGTPTWYVINADGSDEQRLPALDGIEGPVDRRPV